MDRLRWLPFLMVSAILVDGAGGQFIDRSKLIDLTYSFNNKTVYWPNAKGFRHQKDGWNVTPRGYWYAAGEFASAEHGGTHLDSPVHFAQGMATLDRIPVQKLVAPAVVVDVTAGAAKNRDYLATSQDLLAWEKKNGAIPANSVVVFRTGWGKYWPDRKQYLGSDVPGDIDHLHFPGIAKDAAELLVRRKIDGVGIDTASMDYGPSKDFIVHQVLNRAGIYGLENIANTGRATQLIDALRRGDWAAFEKLLRQNPKAAHAKGSGGSTPLMFAALYGNARSVRLLLDQGADPNIRNEAGATALLWAVDDPEKVRLLLEHGADASASSEDGVTPLLLAASRFGSGDVVRLLLDNRAKLEGQPVLARAAATGDEAVMRMLIGRGADKKPLPQDLALRSGCAPCVDLLLQSADREDLTRTLAVSARFGDSKAIRMLLDRGADANGNALRFAAASERMPLEGIQALLDRGARDETALGLAKRLGNTPVVVALTSIGPAIADAPDATVTKPAAGRSARAAVEKSLPLLQHADGIFLTKAGCVSCHNNSLFQMTIAAARKNGFSIDERKAESQLKGIGVYLESWRERVLQDIPIPGAVDTISYILAGLAAVNYTPDPATDALARYVKRRQAADGGWRIATQRPPIESSDFEATAMALRALQVYAPNPQKEEYAKAVHRGAIWLSQAQPRTTEDYVFRLLGLVWARENKRDVRKATRELMTLQTPDGGWAQLSTLASDAYATGQALTALAEAGGLAVTDQAYQRGAQFLLNRQLEDGSWYVTTRAIPSQPYFDSEFPHGRDQFISAAATNWATMALVRAAQDRRHLK